MPVETVPAPQQSKTLIRQFCATAQVDARMRQQLQDLGIGSVDVVSIAVKFDTGYYRYMVGVTGIGDLVVAVSNRDEPELYNRLHVLAETYSDINTLLSDAVHRIREHLRRHDPRALVAV
jgi:hypothetical protein